MQPQDLSALEPGLEGYFKRWWDDQRALWGDEPSWTLVRAIEQEDFAQTQGCTKAAALLVFPAETLSGSYVNPGDKLVAADKRMIDALKTWSDCMRKAGFTYENPNSIEADLRERFHQLTREG